VFGFCFVFVVKARRFKTQMSKLYPRILSTAHVYASRRPVINQPSVLRICGQNFDNCCFNEAAFTTNIYWTFRVVLLCKTVSGSKCSIIAYRSKVHQGNIVIVPYLPAIGRKKLVGIDTVI